MEILPSIDLRDGKVVRLKQGDYARQVNYDVDPVATAKSFREAGANWMHIVDLDGAKEGRPVQTALIEKIIAASGLHVEAGGGVRSTDDISRLLAAGAARVVVGTKAIEDWPWFESLVRDPRLAGKLVLALDAKEGVVATRGWTETSGKLAVDIARQISDWPVAAILYTDVAKDGMLQGPNVEQTRKLAEAGRVPVIASGGVGNIDHIRQVKANSPPIWGCIIGRSLYEGTLDLREAIRVARE
ncbi:MAG: phosphoribosylformimino-5-aminoimidazole carboxamide ribotide isomerase [Phycisphaerales bacterium]|jgi:phosphoribosylformimino-5-aminoimidazole carboxamide ribotide isomerase|nr:phosphoribosylformimino-5-aminoimidazole carboxamide ribotide isomerase [Phycisphaerales bacterium]